MENYICINGKRTDLTPDQLKQLGIEQPKTKIFAEYTMSEIKDIVQRGEAQKHFNLHDTKMIGDMVLEIVNIGANSKGTPQMILMETSIKEKRSFHSGSCPNGWIDSDIRTYLNGPFLESLPAEFRAAISSARLETANSEGEIFTSIDCVFLPSESQLFGSSIFSPKEEGRRFGAFATSKDRQRFDEDGDPTPYWTRSASSGSTAAFVRVGSYGRVSRSGASASFSIAPCFLIA